MPCLLDVSSKGFVKQLPKPRLTIPIAEQYREPLLLEVPVELGRSLRLAYRY